MVGTVPSAVFRSKVGGGWEELEGVRGNSTQSSPELQSRARYFGLRPVDAKPAIAGVEVAGVLLTTMAGLAAGQQRPHRHGRSRSSSL